MANIIHIVNGDAIVPIIEKSGIGGKIVVWREMLCEGPLDEEVASDEFWKKRYQFFEENFGVSKLEYFDKTIKELLKVEDPPVDAELVLWFEFDLFCQINLMALCAYLLQDYRKDILYSLVCTGKVKGKDKMQSLTDFSAEDFPKLYDKKLKITRDNFLFSEKCWKVFVKNNAEELSKFNFNKKSKFQYFQLAINQHLKRFPAENGLNQIQQKILEIINTNTFTNSEIVQKMLIWQQSETVYGFGDLQYFWYLDKLNCYLDIKEEKYYLNSLGKEIIG
jgi:hypothetical protein